jgi:hypothetical protein
MTYKKLESRLDITQEDLEKELGCHCTLFEARQLSPTIYDTVHKLFGEYLKTKNPYDFAKIRLYLTINSNKLSESTKTIYENIMHNMISAYIENSTTEK